MSSASHHIAFALALLITSSLLAGCGSATPPPATRLTSEPSIFVATPEATATDAPTLVPPDTPTPESTATDVPTAEPTNTMIVEDPPEVGPKVIIETIFFDGIEPRAEGDEYAVIANVGDAAQNMDGWRLNADDEGQDFYFPFYILEAGASCRVYTDESHPETCGFNLNSGSAIWRNKGECGYLYNANGVEVSQYCF